jgi:hypothetical protein
MRQLVYSFNKFDSDVIVSEFNNTPSLHDNANVDDVVVEVGATGGGTSYDSILDDKAVITPNDGHGDVVIGTLLSCEVRPNNDRLSISEGIGRTETIITHATNTLISDNGTWHTRHIPQVDGILRHYICYAHAHRNIMLSHVGNKDSRNENK